MSIHVFREELRDIEATDCILIESQVVTSRVNNSRVYSTHLVDSYIEGGTIVGARIVGAELKNCRIVYEGTGGDSPTTVSKRRSLFRRKRP